MRSFNTNRPSLIRQFAKRESLCLRRCEDDDTPIVPGRRGNDSHIYEFNDTALGVIFTSAGSKPPRTQHWRKYRRLCLAAGMTLTQNGDAEGAFVFDDDNREQVRLAIGLAEIRRRRRLSPEATARAIANLQEFRSNPRQEGPISDQERPKATATSVLSLGP